MIIATVVEGHGEVQALPVLLRRLAARRGTAIEVPPPFRLPRGRFVDGEHLARAVSVVARRVPPGQPGGVLLVADADDDCVVELAARLEPVCLASAGGRRVELAFAVREYEAWFLAGDAGLATHRDVEADADEDRDYEHVRDAKGVLEGRMRVRYAETRHQPAFTALFDLDQAASSSRSFRHLVGALDRLLARQRARLHSAGSPGSSTAEHLRPTGTTGMARCRGRRPSTWPLWMGACFTERGGA